MQKYGSSLFIPYNFYFSHREFISFNYRVEGAQILSLSNTYVKKLQESYFTLTFQRKGCLTETLGFERLLNVDNCFMLSHAENIFLFQSVEACKDYGTHHIFSKNNSDHPSFSLFGI